MDCIFEAIVVITDKESRENHLKRSFGNLAIKFIPVFEHCFIHKFLTGFFWFQTTVFLIIQECLFTLCDLKLSIFEVTVTNPNTVISEFKPDVAIRRFDALLERNNNWNIVYQSLQFEWKNIMEIRDIVLNKQVPQIKFKLKSI